MVISGSSRAPRLAAFLAVLATAAQAAGLMPWGVSPAAAAWTRTITMNIVGDGDGTLTSDDGEILCLAAGGAQSGDCVETYVVPDFIDHIDLVLTWDPATGSYVCVTFGDCYPGGATQTRTITISRDGGDVTLTSAFNLKTYTVLADAFPDGNGQVLGNGSPCTVPAGYDFCQRFRHGDGVTLRAEPGQGGIFTGWRVEPCLGQGATCTFTAASDVRVTATFNYWLVRIVSPADGGTVCAAALDPRVAAACAPRGDDFAFFGRHERRHEFAADPAPGWRFKGWGGGPCGGQGATCVITLTGDTTIKPRFEPIPAPTATPKATPKPTPKTTPKPTPRPTAGQTADPTDGPAAATLAPSPAAEGGIPPDVSTPPAAASSSSTPAPTAAPMATSVPTFAVPAPATTPDIGGLSPLVVVLLAVIGALVLVIGYLAGSGRRSRGAGAEAATPPRA